MYFKIINITYNTYKNPIKKGKLYLNVCKYTLPLLRCKEMVRSKNFNEESIKMRMHGKLIPTKPL